MIEIAFYDQIFSENISVLNSLIIEILFVFVAFWRLQCTFRLETNSVEHNLVYFLPLVMINGFLTLEHG